MLWSIGFLVTFLFGGLTGIILACPAAGLPVSDTYFVVAHFHYVVFGTVVFAMFAGFYFWWPKMTGRMLDERLGKIHFWMLFIGFHTTFLIQHWLGVEGMPRRYADYLPEDGFTLDEPGLDVGAFMLGASTLPFLCNVYTTWRNAPAGHGRRPVGLRRARSSGPRPARRRGTTSRRCRGSAPSARRSTCTTPRSPRWTTSSPNPGPLDWEADRRGQESRSPASASRTARASRSSRPRRSSRTRPGTDEEGTR